MENEKILSTKVETLPAEVKKEIAQRIVPIVSIQDEITKLIPFAGTVEITEEQKRILFAPVKDENVEIRPDGLVYLPWPEYVTRLRDAFGISWAIIPKDMPRLEGGSMYWAFYLIIQGKLAGFAIGEQAYIASNAQMSYSDASEGAKSNALMRLCKGLGISLELWTPSFIRNWKKKYAENYFATWPDGKPKLDKMGKQKTEWRKKGTSLGEIVENGTILPESLKKEPVPMPQENKTEPKIPPKEVEEYITEPQRKRFYAIAKSTKAADDQIKEWLYREYDIEHSKDIPKSMYDEICTKVKEALSNEPGSEG